jgi:hypothetical protein
MGIAPGKEEGKENRREQNSPGIFKKGKQTHKKLLYGLMMVKGDNPGGGPRLEPGNRRPEQGLHQIERRGKGIYPGDKPERREGEMIFYRMNII